MAKTKISEFSTTAGNNTDINSINIAEGCAPSGINDAIRELMRQLKEFQTGGAGDSVNSGGDFSVATNKFTVASASGNTAVAGTLAVTGVATLTAQPILSSLTASKAVFTDASKGLVSNDVTGTGNVVMSNSPTLVTPALGTPSSGVVTNLTGTASININGTVGATTPSTGAFTTLSSTGNTTLGDASGDTITVNGTTTFVNANPTLSAGTANGVLYLNGSKVATSGSALTFDGTTVGIQLSGRALNIGTTSAANFYSAYRYNSGDIGYIGNGPSVITAGSSTTDFAIGTASTNPLLFAINSTEGMRLTSTGLGIGTSSPSSKLVVQQGSGAYQAIQIIASNSGEDAGIRFQGGTGKAFRIQQPAASAGLFFYDETNSATRLTIDSSGNLGIGTSSPTAKLDVYGTSTQYIFLRNATTTNQIAVDSSAAYFGSVTNSPVVFTANNGEKMRLDSSGNLGIGTSSPSTIYSRTVHVSAAGAAGYVMTDSTTPRTYAIGANSGTLQFYDVTAGTERARIDSSGNFSIGTAAIATTATDGFLYIPTCAGTPTGTPTAKTGLAPMVIDSTNNKMYIYSGGAWRALN